MHTIKNIRSGFHKSGSWNFDEWRPSISTLNHSMDMHCNHQDRKLTLPQLMEIFDKDVVRCWHPLLLRLSYSGKISLNFTGGIRYTSEEVLSALREKEEMTKLWKQSVLLKTSLFTTFSTLLKTIRQNIKP